MLLILSLVWPHAVLHAGLGLSESLSRCEQHGKLLTIRRLRLPTG